MHQGGVKDFMSCWVEGREGEEGVRIANGALRSGAKRLNVAREEREMEARNREGEDAKSEDGKRVVRGW